MSDKKIFKFKTFYERTVEVDLGGDGESIDLPIRIRRFTVSELQEFRKGYDRFASPPQMRFIFRRPENADEHEKVFDEKEQEELYVVTDAEIARRRIAEMAPETRAEFDRLKEEHNAFVVEFAPEMVTKHISVSPLVDLQVEGENGEAKTVSSGKELADAIAGNLMMLGQLTSLIFEANVLSPEEKKRSRSRSDSTDSSPTPSAKATPAGAIPAATATSAGLEGSAQNAGVSADQVSSQSGATTVTA